MRALALLLAAGCSAAAAAPDDVTQIKPVAMAGPYKTVLESCRAARPCGFLDMDDRGNERKPATRTDCDAVVDPSIGIASRTVPVTMIGGKADSAPKVTHKLPAGGGEIRIASVTCAVPKGLRREHAEYYVFVQRADGWWRTEQPLWTYDYNDKYCGGGMYIIWNDKPARTIAGIAASFACLACSKQSTREDIVELMLRVETAGAKPLVFPPLPVGARSKNTVDGSPGKDDTEPDCKPLAKARSQKENWLSDDEVELSGTDGVGGPLDRTFEVNGRIQPAAAGRYRFVR